VERVGGDERRDHEDVGDSAVDGLPVDPPAAASRRWRQRLRLLCSRRLVTCHRDADNRLDELARRLLLGLLEKRSAGDAVPCRVCRARGVYMHGEEDGRLK
jgi:hypothetical protein